MGTAILIVIAILAVIGFIIWISTLSKKAEKSVRLEEVAADKEKIIVAVKEKQDLANSVINSGLSDDALRERVRLERDQLRNVLQPK